MPYKKPKMTPKAAARVRASGRAVARTKVQKRGAKTDTSLMGKYGPTGNEYRNPSKVKGLSDKQKPVYGKAAAIAAGFLPAPVGPLARLASLTAAGKYAPKYGQSGPRSLPEWKAAVKTEFRERKNPTKSQWTEDNPRTRVIKAYAKAPFEKNRNTRPPTTNAESAAKLRANAAAAAKLRATRAKAKTSPMKRKR